MFSGSWKEIVACLGFELTVPMSRAVLSSYALEYGAGWEVEGSGLEADCLHPLVQWFLNVWAWEAPGGPVKNTDLLSPPPELMILASLGWGLGMCIPNTFPENAADCRAWETWQLVQVDHSMDPLSPSGGLAWYLLEVSRLEFQLCFMTFPLSPLDIHQIPV